MTCIFNAFFNFGFRGHFESLWNSKASQNRPKIHSKFDFGTTIFPNAFCIRFWSDFWSLKESKPEKPGFYLGKTRFFTTSAFSHKVAKIATLVASATVAEAAPPPGLLVPLAPAHGRHGPTLIWPAPASARRAPGRSKRDFSAGCQP